MSSLFSLPFDKQGIDKHKLPDDSSHVISSFSSHSFSIMISMWKKKKGRRRREDKWRRLEAKPGIRLTSDVSLIAVCLILGSVFIYLIWEEENEPGWSLLTTSPSLFFPLFIVPNTLLRIWSLGEREGSESQGGTDLQVKDRQEYETRSQTIEQGKTKYNCLWHETWTATTDTNRENTGQKRERKREWNKERLVLH